MPATLTPNLSRQQKRTAKRLRQLHLSPSERLFVDRFYGDAHSYDAMAALLGLTVARVQELHESLLARAKAEDEEQKRKARIARVAARQKRRRK
jgi:hypothetical protein